MNKAIIATAYMFSPIALGPALAVSITYKCNNGSIIQADTVKQSIIVTDKDGTSFVQPNVRINDPYIFYGPPEYYLRLSRKTGELDWQSGTQWIGIGNCTP
jgi:hypothetical protein